MTIAHKGVARAFVDALERSKLKPEHQVITVELAQDVEAAVVKNLEDKLGSVPNSVKEKIACACKELFGNIEEMYQDKILN